MVVVRNLNQSNSKETSSWVIPRKPGILIADDMGLILTCLKFELEPRGFNVWVAVDSDDALDLYRRHRAEIDLVLLEVRLPGLDGPRTLAAMRRTDPGVLACFMTENLDTCTNEELLHLGAARVFNKPFRAAEVAHWLRELMESTVFKSIPDRSSWQRRLYDSSGIPRL